MPVNDPMYTVAQIEKLRKVLPEDHPLRMPLIFAEDLATFAASESAKAVMLFFDSLKKGMEDPDPEIAAKAAEIYNGPYYVEIA